MQMASNGEYYFNWMLLMNNDKMPSHSVEDAHEMQNEYKTKKKKN